MFGLPVLDVVIGLTFVYLLLALICTAINEGIASQTRTRAKLLEDGLTSLVGPETKQLVYDHALISSATASGDSVPRRIVRSIAHRAPVKAFGEAASRHVNADQKPSYITPRDFALAIHDLAERNELPDGKAKEALVALSRNSSAPPIPQLEAWFDNAMDRVTGRYKRHAQAWIRLLAVMIVIATNADTFDIARRLWKDPTLRAAVVQEAKVRSEKPRPRANIDYTDADVVISEEPAEIGETGKSGGFKNPLSERENELLGQLIGWQAEVYDANAGLPFAMWVLGRFEAHWLGWLLTAVAVSLGAPFWFDMLNKLMNIRSAGRSPREKAKGVAK
jgi:hypothetical protein